MIPLVGFPKELEDAGQDRARGGQEGVRRKGRQASNYLVGTMIEMPRARVVADEIAKNAEFFSFGTNDLTQTDLGMSRDDYGSFIRHYQENDIVPNDPFQTIDLDGVGGLMRIGGRKGPQDRARTSSSASAANTAATRIRVKFCHKIGLNYVSCSPFRVPIARLAAAQAVLGK